MEEDITVLTRDLEATRNARDAEVDQGARKEETEDVVGQDRDLRKEITSSFNTIKREIVTT